MINNQQMFVKTINALGLNFFDNPNLNILKFWQYLINALKYFID
jgi:hypothetical protein